MSSYNPDPTGFQHGLRHDDTYRSQSSRHTPSPTLTYRGRNDRSGPSSGYPPPGRPGIIAPGITRRPLGQSHRTPSRQDASDDDRDAQDDDVVGHDESKPEKHTKRQETAYPNQSFACPFARSDPAAHPACLGYSMKRIGDVKLHLQRFHMKPVHCPRCGRVFRGPRKCDDHDAHMQGPRCARVNFGPLPGLSPEDMGKLRKCGEASQNFGSRYERRWYGVWYFLFPDTTAPSTPYAGSEFQERTDLAAQHVASDPRVRDLANGFPPGQHEAVLAVVNTVIQGFKRHASAQPDARPKTMSSHPVSQSPFGQASRQPSEQPGHVLRPEQTEGLLEEYDSWNHNGPVSSVAEDFASTFAAATPSFSPASFGLLSPGPFGTSAPYDNSFYGSFPTNNNYPDHRQSRRDYQHHQ